MGEHTSARHQVDNVSGKEESKVKTPEGTHGLIRVGVYRSWSIRWPFRSDRYVYLGTKADAIKAAKGLQGDWPYNPSIRETKL